MKFRDLGMKSKIFSYATLPLILITILSAATLGDLLEIRCESNRSYAASAGIRSALEIEVIGLETWQTAERYLKTDGESLLEEYRSKIKTVEEGLAELDKTLSQAPEKLSLIRKSAQAFKDWNDRIAGPTMNARDKSPTGGTSNVASYLNQESGSFDRFLTLLAEFRNLEQIEEEASRQKAFDRVVRSIVTLPVGLAVVVALGLAFPAFTASTTTKPLSETAEMAEAIGIGDFSHTLDADRKDEVGRIAASLNSVAKKFRLQRSRVKDGNAVTNEIAAAVKEFTTGIQTTSTAFQQTISAIEEVKQSANFTGAKARDVAERSLQVVSVAEIGKQATEGSIEKINTIKTQMESIGETVATLSRHSDEIEAIMATVQDLAEQSNVLAVNASIEASRAGEHGKAFSVVAHEIKSLADQSKAATLQVRTILDDTQKWVKAVVTATEEGSRAVESGVEQSLEAASAIRKLGKSVQEGAEAATVISSSSDQQTQGIVQISDAMVNIEEAMQQSVSATTQLGQSMEKLADIGKDLSRTLNRNQLRSGRDHGKKNRETPLEYGSASPLIK